MEIKMKIETVSVTEDMTLGGLFTFIYLSVDGGGAPSASGL